MPLIFFPINTERMSLAPATMKLYLLELHDRPAFASTLNAHVPQEWPPDQITPEVIEEFIGRMQARDRKIWTFYWLLRQEKSELPVLIGNGGFLVHENGTLEIGYSMLSDYQNKGYATEAVRSMLQWAFSNLKQFVLSLIVNQHGIPLFMNTHSWNASDKNTILEAIKSLKSALRPESKVVE